MRRSELDSIEQAALDSHIPVEIKREIRPESKPATSFTLAIERIITRINKNKDLS